LLPFFIIQKRVYYLFCVCLLTYLIGREQEFVIITFYDCLCYSYVNVTVVFVEQIASILCLNYMFSQSVCYSTFYWMLSKLFFMLKLCINLFLQTLCTDSG